MNILIFTFGLVLVIFETESAKTAEEVNDQINAVKNDIKAIITKTNSIEETELPNLPQQILKITESNKLIVQTKQELQKYVEKGEDCRALFIANYYSIVDQIYVKANDDIIVKLTNVEKSLKTVDLKLEAMKKQVDNWDKTSAADKNKIVKGVNGYSNDVDESKKQVDILVQSTLDNIEKKIFTFST